MNSSHFNVLLLHYSSWLFRSLCRTYSWSARKLLSRPFIFCHNPLVIKKVLFATISWEKSYGSASHIKLYLDISAKVTSLEPQTCIQNLWDAKTQERKGYDNGNCVYKALTKWNTKHSSDKGFTLEAVKSSLEKQSWQSLKTLILWLITINHPY